MIKIIFSNSRQTYGSPRIHAEIKAQGINVSRPRVARLMKQLGLAAKMQSLFKVTTRVNKKRPVAPDSKWVVDIRYIRTLEGWLYITVILDLYSRKVVGLSMANSLGCCFDNAVVESFFHSLKTECVYFERYELRE